MCPECSVEGCWKRQRVSGIFGVSFTYACSPVTIIADRDRNDLPLQGSSRNEVPQRDCAFQSEFAKSDGNR